MTEQSESGMIGRVRKRYIAGLSTDHTLNSCVKVMCAAHAMTNSITLLDMRDLTEREQG